MLLHKREREAKPPAAEREYDGPEEAGGGIVWTAVGDDGDNAKHEGGTGGRSVHRFFGACRRRRPRGVRWCIGNGLDEVGAFR